MRAVLLDTDDTYRITELDEPAPAAGQVAIRVSHVGVQWGDVLVADGRFPVPRPFAPGFDVAGEIVAVGEGVDPGRVGERVSALTLSGGYAEVAVTSAELALPVGELSPVEAAGFGWGGVTAYEVVHTVGRIRPGDAVLIHAAAGGVGTMAAQYARLAGAGRIVGVVGSAAKVEYATRFGYDEVVVGAQFPDQLRDQRFDLILDSVGEPASRANLGLLATHGRLVVFGNAGGGEEFTVSGSELTYGNRAVLGYSSFTLAQSEPVLLGAAARRALEPVLDGRVRVDVTARYPLAELDTAVRRLADRTSVGRTVIEIGKDA
ncbi:zinc-binding alcohol dehydrogenase family protein [Longispora sp. K20-0274]|uniref:quinone oxidoreductase family protein n=1 Tax=Longispora sp. K20-0274 TaxID=3088255 RepID=UPI00399BD2F1